MIFVNSSAIRAVSYNAQSMELHILFTGGNSYTHRRVPKYIYEGLLRARSKGTYYNQRIRFRYP